MNYILLGVLSFVFMFIFDWYTLHNKPVKKSLFGILGLCLFIYSTLQVTRITVNFEFSLIQQISAGLLSIIALLLLIYSLFLELPFVKTYGEELHNNSLITSGTYALTRHPGVLWFGLFFLFLFLTTGKLFVLYAGIIWSMSDILYVVLQERFIFNKMFPSYSHYKKTTPMLIPTKSSFTKCLKTLK